MSNFKNRSHSDLPSSEGAKVSLLGELKRLASRLSRSIKRGSTIAALVTASVLAAHTVSAQLATPPVAAVPLPLSSVSIPEPDNLEDFVRDKTAAIALGKALFWDMQLGSDGKETCATCHFHAGADSRKKNQLNPGLLRVNQDARPNPDITFNPKGPNYTLTPADYPFHKLADPNNNSSTVLKDTNDVTGSQGVFNADFVSVNPGSAQDNVVTGSAAPDQDGFRVGSVNVRRVEPRHTPTVINAVFNFRNFWDGRAQDEFNGVNPFGSRDPNAKVFKATTPGKLEEVRVSLKNSSLASQAVGPPLSSFELSSDGRTFQDIGDKFGPSDKKVHSAGKGKKLPRKAGKKLLPLRPLAGQLVAPDDSVLGPFSNLPQPGLTTATYQQMIEAAFQSIWWKSSKAIQIAADGSRTVVNKPDIFKDPNTFSLEEYNFPLFFGLAIQLYEATLVADNTPFDQYAAGNTSALTTQQQKGLQIFLGLDEKQGGGRCINCHTGSELTNASVTAVSKNQLRRRQGDLIDVGFNNIGVRSTTEDLGLGADDLFGNSLSLAKLAVQGKFNDPNLSPALSYNEKLGVDGAMKVPGLRNVELTAPYFHNGGQGDLNELVDFYNRGGDFEPKELSGRQIAPLAKLSLKDEDKQALVAFLKGLTDERVRFERAPFDHPQIFISNGHPGEQNSVTDSGNGNATDDFLEIPTVGRNGLASPPPNFLD